MLTNFHGDEAKKIKMADSKKGHFRMNLWGQCFSQNTNKKLSGFLPYCSEAHSRAEILIIFRSYFGRNNDFINSFWNCLIFSAIYTTCPFGPAHSFKFKKFLSLRNTNTLSFLLELTSDAIKMPVNTVVNTFASDINCWNIFWNSLGEKRICRRDFSFCLLCEKKFRGGIQAAILSGRPLRIIRNLQTNKQNKTK